LNIPLAHKVRPKSLKQIIGQHHLLDDGKPLKAIFSQKVLSSSLLFCGPPGCGKTTVSLLIKDHFSNQEFESLNAVTSNVKELKSVIDGFLKGSKDLPPILFIDEIHRFNSKQQDALLPYIEEGKFVLIATSTLSPYQTLTRPMLSRVNIFNFKALNIQEIIKLLRRIDKDNLFSETFLENIAEKCDGDGRRAINFLEICFSRKNNNPNIDEMELIEGLRFIPTASFKNSHYDYISAFIKSLRGSDPDAAMYYLAAMLKMGDDPRYIARRMIIFASEDIGNADPNALNIALSIMKAIEYVGLPEAAINLAHGVTYLACTPKSNASYMALKRAQKYISERGSLDKVPEHLKNHGQGSKQYKYPHNYPNHFVSQKYMENPVRFYEPSNSGFEKKIKEFLEFLRSSI